MTKLQMRNLFYELPDETLEIIYQMADKMAHQEKSKDFLEEIRANGKMKFFQSGMKIKLFERALYTSSISSEIKLFWEFFDWLREHFKGKRPRPIPPSISNPYYSLWVSNNPWYADSLRFN
jgi:hypothetical protein